ncbi:hypothetical protein MA16_Dca028496 [Dendrobium catenatum]|uniref:Uncharacterized protein n=1 Tax=Dendrobium catenatum TaxID=906689 RepID=A0A2I0VAS3_9ASPA|nr:hypothetical protein MA16_Dca028496 [Dendrobium catenatum]
MLFSIANDPFSNAVLAASTYFGEDVGFKEDNKGEAGADGSAVDIVSCVGDGVEDLSLKGFGGVIKHPAPEGMEEYLISASELRLYRAFNDRRPITVDADVHLKQLELIEWTPAASYYRFSSDAFSYGTLYISKLVQVVIWMDSCKTTQPMITEC